MGRDPAGRHLRLRHMMYLIAAMAILFWLVILAFDSEVDRRRAGHGWDCVFVRGGAWVGLSSWLAPGHPAGCAVVRAGDRGGARHAAGSGRSWHSPISIGACRTGGS